MKEKEIPEVKEIVEFISKDMNKIGIKNLPVSNSVLNLNELKKFLTTKITEMMDNDYEKLISALYMIDIDEKRLHDLFSGKNREFIPAALADLILERQIEKLVWRKRYREGKL